jgi:tetratricopeptide (TPR) repeat protein
MDDVRDGGLALAGHYIDIGNDRAALDALARVDGEALHDPEYWLIRAAALRGLDRSEESADAARRGLAIDPEDVSLLDSLALAELDRDNFGAAVRALDAAVEIEPEHPVLHAHRALVLALSGRHLEAREAVALALSLDPENVSALRARAQVALIAEDDPATVRAHVADLLEVAPEDQVGHSVLGALSARQKDFRRSARELAEAARIDPTNRHVALSAREARVYAHPVLAPVRPVWRFGRWRAYAMFLGLSAILAAAHQTTLRLVLACVWLAIVVLSRAGPRILRRLERRKYGG